jgi:glycosyltransferase involved in cell wall biosynthesis
VAAPRGNRQELSRHVSASSGERILIEALGARFGGTAYAAVQLAKHLGGRPDVEAVVVVTRQGSLISQGLFGADGVECHELSNTSRIELVRRVIWQAIRLPRLVNSRKVDCVISMSGMLPRRVPAKLTLLLFNPVMYEVATGANRLRRLAVRRTARRAALVAAPSHRMAELASSSTGRRCAVVPLGVDRKTFRPGSRPREELLCVADFYPHKRHEVLLDAWLRLPAPRPTLRLVGNPDVAPDHFARVSERIDSMRQAGTIIVEHGLSLDELVAAYQRARVFALASERESFCLPLAESMACGVPPVVRDIPALRETGGEGARYVAGNDSASWSEAISEILQDDRKYQSASNRALQAVARLSWESFADHLLS